MMFLPRGGAAASPFFIIISVAPTAGCHHSDQNITAMDQQPYQDKIPGNPGEFIRRPDKKPHAEKRDDTAYQIPEFLMIETGRFINDKPGQSVNQSCYQNKDSDYKDRGNDVVDRLIRNHLFHVPDRFTCFHGHSKCSGDQLPQKGCKRSSIGRKACGIAGCQDRCEERIQETANRYRIKGIPLLPVFVFRFNGFPSAFLLS